MDDAGEVDSAEVKMKEQEKAIVSEEEEEDEEEVSDSDDDEEDTIARIQRAHFAQQAAALRRRQRAPARPRQMSQKRKMEAVKTFHDFTKKLKKDTGISIRGLVGNNILDLSDYSSEDSKSDSDGLSEEEFVVNPNAVQELNEEDESYIDPETGDFVTKKQKVASPRPVEAKVQSPEVQSEEPKTLSISDLINEEDLDLSKANVEIAEVDQGELCPDEKSADDLLEKQEENSQEFDVTDKFKDMSEISVKSMKKDEESGKEKEGEKKPENEDEKKGASKNAVNIRRNIREVMDENQLDASTLAAQRQELERLARVQEQQRIIREVQRQIAINRQNKVHQKTLQLLQGGSSILKKAVPGQKLNLPNTVLVKLPSGEVKKTSLKQGQVEVTRVPKPTTSGAQKSGKPDQKSDKKEVVEIVSSSGEESSSSSSDSDDCIMLSDSEVPPSPEAEEDPNNSGLHVNDADNVPDDQGRVLINFGHPENEQDIFLAPQIARIIKPHQIGGVRFLFDNIIESIERFSTSTGFGCILAHSMGLGKTLQIVCFTDIFLRHTNSKTVLCIMPINTLQNWVAEFNKWLPVEGAPTPLAAQGEVRPRNFPIYVLNDSHKTLQMRAKVVKDWTTTGGVLMIGYELYRLLSMKKDKKPRKKRKADIKLEKEEKEKEDKKNELVNEDTQNSDATNQSKISEDSKDTKEEDPNKAEDGKDEKKREKKEYSQADQDKKLLDEMYAALVKPGPDLVICDEGHRIKNSHSNISYALKQMRTKRRVVLTGYPLQNNLIEYWCMVDFVRPNYLGTKTEFCNMFERPIQNGQCIDSTPQDIKLMRYRAHVLHSLLVGFVQRRSHAVLQSTLPQKEEYVLLVRMTPLQRKLYERFMNEVVRSTSVPNPLKAFAICCKIWNHPDVLYNFLRKRSEANAIIEEDLDLEEIGGVTKAGRASRSKAPPRRAAKPRGSSKKPAATIQPNTSSTAPPNPNFSQHPAPYGQQSYRPDQSGQYPYNYPNPPQGQGYYPPNPAYNQNYGNNYYPQQAPYPNNYPNQYPQNPADPNYNQNYWTNGGYYGDPNYYNNPQYQNANPNGEYNNQQYPPNYNQNPDPSFQNNVQPYQNNAEFPNQQRPYPGPYPNQPGYPGYNSANPAPYPNQSPGFPNQPVQQGQSYPNQPGQSGQSYPNQPGQPTQSYPNQPGQSGQTYPPQPGQPTQSYPNQPGSPAPNYPNQPGTPGQSYPNQPGQPPQSYPNHPGQQRQGYPNPPYSGQYPENSAYTESGQYNPAYGYPNQEAAGDGSANLVPKTEPGLTPSEVGSTSNAAAVNAGYGSNHPNTSAYPNPTQNANPNYSAPYPYPSHMDVKPNIENLGSPVTSWPIPDTVKLENDRLGDLKAEAKAEVKSESDGEVKIEDLDTKTIVKEDSKGEKVKPKEEVKSETNDSKDKKAKHGTSKSNSDSEDESPKKGKQKGKGKESKKETKKAKGKSKAKGRKDRKASKEESDSEESEKEEKLNKEEEQALVKKAEEMTYDWATELLKDYIPGIIENSSKMELFFYILNESIKMGDRLLLFSQSLFTLNLIEDFLERNYIPGTNSIWERNTNYYRLDGSTHALEREKLINEFNANPHVHLFLVSTRAGSLGINLVGANRVIVFDASWNPCHDTQAVCRVYRYGQKKPCFVYRFVMDCCLEKKIYDRQINKQGMADRVVDECNPDAVLSMKEITNLCFDNDEKETEIKDLSEHKDKYIDVIMQGIIGSRGQLLTKEPFQHESLLVDRKEKKLSSAEKRLAKRGYELEKKAASNPKPGLAYRTVRAADGSLVQRPVASVRPMQHGARWIPADVWRRQGMTAQEMTLPLDVVIPTNSAEKTNIVLKAGQRVMVLKSPKGIYMQLESGKIIAIKTSLKGLGQKGGDSKDGAKKIMPRPTPANLPGSLKNNSAITITSKTGPRPGFQRIIRPGLIQNRIIRPVLGGHRSEIRSRMAGIDVRSYATNRKIFSHNRLMRPGLPGSLSITKISKDIKKEKEGSDDEAQIIDSDDEDAKDKAKGQINKNKDGQEKIKEDKEEKKDGGTESNKQNSTEESTSEKEEKKPNPEMPEKIEEENTGPLVLTTDETLPSESAFETQHDDKSNLSSSDESKHSQGEMKTDFDRKLDSPNLNQMKNMLKNYRHQRIMGRQAESSLSQLERTASTFTKESLPDFRRNLDDITQSYSPGEERPTKSRKKKSPTKVEVTESQNEKTQQPMTHSVSNLLGPSSSDAKSTAPVAPMGSGPQRLIPPQYDRSGHMPMDTGDVTVLESKSQIPPVPHNQSPVQQHSQVPHSQLPQSKVPHSPHPHSQVPHSQHPHSQVPHSQLAHGQLPHSQAPHSQVPHGQHSMPMAPLGVPPAYPAASSMPDAGYSQYPPGYGYGGYPAAGYYGGYPPPYYGGYPPAYGQPPPAAAPAAPAAPEHYLPPNPQW